MIAVANSAGFGHIIGHQAVMSLLRRSVAADRLSHAYLITGPRGVGRRTVALEIAKALNCDEPRELRPCGACRGCRLIERGVHPDVQIVRRAPERKWILLKEPAGGPRRSYMDNVEFIQSDAQLRPADGRKKVYVILEAEELLADAANRLLKTLEEPTSFVHFLLTAGDRRAVMPTIASRCQELRLQVVPERLIGDALVTRSLLDPTPARETARLANGRPGWAISAATDPLVLQALTTNVEQIRSLLGASRVERIVFARTVAEKWSSQQEASREMLRAWSRWLQTNLHGQLGIHSTPPIDERPVSAEFSISELSAALRHVHQALADLDANVNVRLALTSLLLRLPTAA